MALLSLQAGGTAPTAPSSGRHGVKGPDDAGAFAAMLATAGAPEESGGRAGQGSGLLTKLAELQGKARAAFDAATTPEGRQAVLEATAEELGALLGGAVSGMGGGLREALGQLAEAEGAGELSLDGLFALVAVVIGRPAAGSAGQIPPGGPGMSAVAGTVPGAGRSLPVEQSPSLRGQGVARSDVPAAGTLAPDQGGLQGKAAPVSEMGLFQGTGQSANASARGPEATLRAALEALRQGGDGAAAQEPEAASAASDPAKPPTAKTSLGAEAVRAFLQTVAARPEAPTQAHAAAGIAPSDAAMPEAGSTRDSGPGPAPSQSAAPNNGFGRTLMNQIRQIGLSEGTTRVELVPRGLGGIEIEVHPAEDGRLKVVLRAENPAVLNALRGDRDGLLALLGDSGANVRDQDLEFADYGGGAQRDDAPEGSEALAALASEEEEEAAPEIRPTTAAEGRLDIFT